MSKTKILQNHGEFEDDIESIMRYGLMVINAKWPGKTKKEAKKEKSMLLESLLLRSCARWESFVENEMVLLVSMKPKKLNQVMELPLDTKLSIRLTRALLFSDTYRSFYDIDRSKGTFRKFIEDEYNLFDQIGGDRAKKMNFIYRIRNYLSHYSAFSRRKLLSAYKEIYGYRNFLEPGSFLLKQRGMHFEKLVHNFKLVSKSMLNELQRRIP